MNRQKSFENEKATLYVVATPIGNLQEMTPRALKVLESVDVIAAEDTRNTLKLLTHFGIHTRLISHHQHNEAQSANGLLELLRQGQDIALVSDAGYPLISDPGCVVTQKVIEEGFNVVPISGSNAMPVSYTHLSLVFIIIVLLMRRSICFTGYVRSISIRINRLYENDMLI